MVQWYYITRAAYDAIATEARKADNLYYLSDTGEIYRGNQPFTQAVILYDGTEPAVKAVNKIYVNSTTLEGKVWDGTKWNTVIQPLGAVELANTTKPVSGASVSTYVTNAIKDVTGGGGVIKSIAFNSTTKKITATKGDNTTQEVLLDGLGVSMAYDKAAGTLSLKDVSGTVLGTAINLDLERFIQTATYDPKTKKITLSFNDKSAPLVIDVADLVDTYTGGTTNTIDITVASNVMSGNVKVSATAGNTLTATANGLFVPATDISGKMNKMAGNTAVGKFALTAANGEVVGSTVAAGGATLSDTPNATTLATEAAVASIRTTLQTAIGGKMSKVAPADSGEIIVASSTGDAAASGIKPGAAAFAATPLATTLATEAGVKAFGDAAYINKDKVVVDGSVAATVVTASDVKVVSEKALVGLLQWHTTA